MEALSVLKLRAEYELLTTAIQVNIVGVCTCTRVHIRWTCEFKITKHMPENIIA